MMSKTRPTPEYFDSVVIQDRGKFYSGDYIFNNYEQTWLNDIKHMFKKDENVLDVGCGHGKWCSSIQNAGAKYNGIDFSKNMIYIAMQRNPEANWTVADQNFVDGKFFDTVMEVQMLYVYPGHSDAFCKKFLPHCNRVLLFEPEYRRSSHSLLGDYSLEVAQVVQITKEGSSVWNRNLRIFEPFVRGSPRI